MWQTQGYTAGQATTFFMIFKEKYLLILGLMLAAMLLDILRWIVQLRHHLLLLLLSLLFHNRQLQ